MPWTLPCPTSLVGEPYSELALELLESGAVPMGLLRAGGGDSGNPLPYVVTALPAGSGELVVGKGDSVYCLADFAWASEHGISSGGTQPLSQGGGGKGGAGSPGSPAKASKGFLGRSRRGRSVQVAPASPTATEALLMAAGSAPGSAPGDKARSGRLPALEVASPDKPTWM